ncbi:5'-nucleotidase C-terminal domain-containing protein, partial [Proteiniclasticum sp.]|uniref:5'-nucleotidase C-terminal domain-containing protein n=1 Tax=Proteiniclasticum sp. TaxID=2053595 RepID=UPI00289EBB76
MRKRSFTKFLSVTLLLLFSFALLPIGKISADEILEPVTDPSVESIVDKEEPVSNPEVPTEEETVPETETEPLPVETPVEEVVDEPLMAPLAVPASVTLDYYALNDLHGTIDGSASTSNPGLAKIQQFLLDFKATNPYTYLLSAGDQYQGSTISNLSYGDVTNKILKQMGMLTSAIGNHEFDWGSKLIPQWAKDGGFPFIASNIEVEASAKPAEWDTYVKPYWVHEETVNGKTIRVGFIGIATPETAYKVAAANVVGFKFTDPVAATNKWAEHLRDVENVDAVIALTHLGSDQKDGTITGEIVDYANKITGVDGIFSGHTHRLVKGTVNNIPVVQGMYNGRALGKLSLTFTETPDGYELDVVTPDVFNIKALRDPLVDKVKKSLENEDPTDDLKLEDIDYKDDPVVAEMIKNAANEYEAVLNKKIGVLTQDLSHDMTNVQVTPMGQFVAKTMAELGKTQIAIVNGGGVRAGLDKGDITMGDMYTILPFDNTLVTLEVSGAELKKLIDHGIMSPDFRPGQFYGIEVFYDKNDPYKQKVNTIRLLDGSLVQDDKMYSVSTLDFLLTGGDKYDFSKAKNVVDTYLPLRDLIAEAIQKMGTVDFTFKQNLFEGDSLRVDYFSINDFHGNVSNSGKNPGLAKIATFLKQKIAANPYTYFLSSGDHFQGTAISNLTKGTVVNKILDEMNILASAIGNHEFDWGSDLIPQWAKDGKYVYLASNIEVDAAAKPEGWDDYVLPYIVQEQVVNGKTVKIGFIGIATPETKYKTSAAHVEGFTFTDPVAATNKWSKYLLEEEGVDAVIALTHLGSFQKEGVISGEIVEYANKVQGVDAIFTGHTHQVVNGKVNDIVIVQGAYNGRNISQISLDFRLNNDAVTLHSVTGTVTNLTDLIGSLSDDPAVKAIEDAYKKELQPILDEVIGTLKNDLPHDTDTMQLSPMGQFIAKSLAELGKTQIAIVNGGGIRRGFDAGKITMGLMYELLPFDNTLVTMKVTGAELKKLLEHGLHPDSFRPGQFYGVEVWYDKDKPAGERISSIRLLDGTLVKDTGVYTVSTLDFLLTGGDNYDFSKATEVVDTYIPVRDLIADMIREEEEISHTFLEHLHVGADTTSEKPTLPATGAASSGAFYGLGLISLMAGA